MRFDRNAVIKNRYTLYLLPLVLTVLALLYHFLGTVAPAPDAGVIPMGTWLSTLSSDGSRAVGVLLLLLVSYLLFFVAERYHFLSVRTVLPAVLYSLLGIGWICRIGVSSHLPAALFLVLALARLLESIRLSHKNGPLFDIGWWVMLAVLISPEASLLILWALVSVPLSGRATLKDLTALLIGLLTPLIGVLGYAHFFGSGEEIWQRFLATFTGYPFAWRYDLEWILPAAMLLLAIGRAFAFSATLAVSQRRGLFSVVFLLFFLVATFFVLPVSHPGFLALVFVPAAYLLSYYFVTDRSRWLGILLFCLLLLYCLWMYLPVGILPPLSQNS